MNVAGPLTRTAARYGLAAALALAALAAAAWWGPVPRPYTLAAIPAVLLAMVCARPAFARRDPLVWISRRWITQPNESDTGPGLLVGTLWYPEPYPRPRPLRVHGHTITIAPSGTGKSRTAMAALAEWPGPAIVTDPKRELLGVSGYRPGPIYQWDIQDVNQCSPIGIAQLYGSQKAAVNALIESLIPREETKNSSNQAPFNRPWGAALLAFLEDAAHRGQPPWTEATRKALMGFNEQELKNIPPTSPGYSHAQLCLQIAKSQNYWGSIQGTGVLLMARLNELAPALDAPAPPLDNPSGPSTIYIVGLNSTNPAGVDAALMRWLLGGLWAYQRNQRKDGTDSAEVDAKQNTLYLIDEAGVLAPHFMVEAIMVGRGLNATVWAIAQSLSQLKAAYGAENAQSLLDAMNGALIIYPGNDPSWVTERLRSLLRHGQHAKPGQVERWSNLAVAEMARRKIGLVLYRGDVQLVRPSTPPQEKRKDPVLIPRTPRQQSPRPPAFLLRLPEDEQ